MRKLVKRIDLAPGTVLLYIFMVVLVAFTALPLIYVVNTAFKPIDELFLFPPRYFVKNPTTINFTNLVLALNSSVVPFTRYVFNSLLVTAVVVATTVVVSSLAAYGMVKHKPPDQRHCLLLPLQCLCFHRMLPKFQGTWS